MSAIHASQYLYYRRVSLIVLALRARLQFAVADSGSSSSSAHISFYHSFSHSHHAPHQPHSLASRLVASSSTPRARPSQRDVSQERELCVLWIARHLSFHPNAAHREDGATHTTTTSFDMRFAVRASLLTVCLLRMTRTAPHRHTHSYSALLEYARAHRSPARVQHIAHADADTLTQSRATNIVTVPTTKCRITPSPTRIDSIAPFSTDHVSCTDAAREGGGGH